MTSRIWMRRFWSSATSSVTSPAPMMSPLLNSMMSRLASTSRMNRPLYASMPPEMSCRFMPWLSRFT